VTTFRTPPKNLAAMFDYGISGPLAGMIASIIAIALGSQLTGNVPDLPALPLEILRQSTLGGGIIDTFLGDGTGVLDIPSGAIGTEAVASMTVNLHPIAVAGYISLLVNALNVLPIGSKCRVLYPTLESKPSTSLSFAFVFFYICKENCY
jgi:membrane-associated protease RseP (regulator of RpoE activity)